MTYSISTMKCDFVVNLQDCFNVTAWHCMFCTYYINTPQVRQPECIMHNCTSYIALSPGPSQLFSLAGKKRERAWDLKSRDNCWQNGVVLALPQSVDFKPVWHLWSIKCSSVRPLRIILPSLIVDVAFFFTRIEPEHSKIVLAHARFSRSATLPTLVYGPTSCT